MLSTIRFYDRVSSNKVGIFKQIRYEGIFINVKVRLSWSVPNTSKNVARIETPDPISRNVTLGGKPFKVNRWLIC